MKIKIIFLVMLLVGATMSCSKQESNCSELKKTVEKQQLQIKGLTNAKYELELLIFKVTAGNNNLTTSAVAKMDSIDIEYQKSQK